MKVCISMAYFVINIFSLRSFTFVYFQSQKIIFLNASSELLSFHIHLEMDLFPCHLWSECVFHLPSPPGKWGQVVVNLYCTVSRRFTNACSLLVSVTSVSATDTQIGTVLMKDFYLHQSWMQKNWPSLNKVMIKMKDNELVFICLL